MGSSILERKVIYAGDIFIKAGQEHSRAYIVQQGLIRSFIEENDIKVYIQDFGPGRLIGEICLMSDEPMTISYEAVENTTVVAMTRQDFQQKLAKLDEGIAQVLEHIMMKLNYQYASELEEAQKKATMDDETKKLVSLLTVNMPEERRFAYEKAILPHVNALMGEMKRLKEEDDNAVVLDAEDGAGSDDGATSEDVENA